MMTTYELAAKQSATLSADTINGLQSQFDTVRQRINEMDDSQDAREVYCLLCFVKDVWSGLGYGYKFKELADAAIYKTYRRKAGEVDCRDGCKTDARRRTAQRAIDRFGAVIADLCVLRDGVK